MKYKTKPQTVEAFQWNWELDHPDVKILSGRIVQITNAGVFTLRAGDWIVKYPTGIREVFTDYQFHDAFDEVENESTKKAEKCPCMDDITICSMCSDIYTSRCPKRKI